MTSHTSSKAPPSISIADEEIDPFSLYTGKQNWRINMLARPKRITEKYQPSQEIYIPSVPSSALSVACSERSEHLARPPIRRLEITKQQFKFKGEKYVKRMDRKIEEAWNSIYNYYKKAEKELALKKKKSKMLKAKSSKSSISSAGSKKSKKSQQEREKDLEEWCNLRAQPKKPPPRPPIDRGKRIKDLGAIQEHMTNLSTPKDVIPKFDPEEPYWKSKVKQVPEEALTYEPTERILELAKVPSFRKYKKPEPEQYVKPSALTYKISERVAVLATPKPRQKGPDTEFKEDPFAISPNALKYVATPRILELAKPVER